jgi:hypothetical protein
VKEPQNLSRLSFRSGACRQFRTQAPNFKAAENEARVLVADLVADVADSSPHAQRRLAHVHRREWNAIVWVPETPVRAVPRLLRSGPAAWAR